MVCFVHKLELIDHKYQTNGTVRDDHFNGKFLFLMMVYVPFGTDHQSMYFISTRFLKDKIYGVCVPQFQLFHIRDTTNSVHKQLVDLCRDLDYMWWGNQ